MNYYRVTYVMGETTLFVGEYSTTSVTRENYAEISAEEYLALTEKVKFFYKIVDENGEPIGVQSGGGRVTDSNYIEILPPEYYALCEELGIDQR